MPEEQARANEKAEMNPPPFWADIYMTWSAPDDIDFRLRVLAHWMYILLFAVYPVAVITMASTGFVASREVEITVQALLTAAAKSAGVAFFEHLATRGQQSGKRLFAWAVVILLVNLYVLAAVLLRTAEEVGSPLEP